MSGRVVCTGIGIISSIGSGKDEFWDGIVNTRCGVKPLVRLNEERFTKKVAYEMKESFPDEEKIGRASAMAVFTAKKAIEDAGLNIEDGTGALVIGTGLCDGKGIEDGYENGSFFNYYSLSENVSRYVKSTGPTLTISTGCSSANHAIGYGFDLIRKGEVEMALVGGTDCVTSVMFGILDRVNTSTPTCCKPFNAERKGVLLGDGAAFLVLEDISRAVSRKAGIYGEIYGYGLSCDANHPTAPDKYGMAAAISKALRNSKTEISDIDYIAMHGTGTILNDIIETEAVKHVFGEYSRKVATSSIKAMTGHTGGASGALSTVSTLLAIKHGLIPPTIFLDQQDSKCDLDYTPNETREADLKKVLINAFGFGGNNACVVLGKY